MPRRVSSKRKIAVAGTINRDTIHLHHGKTVETWGGLLYSIKYLCDQAGPAAAQVSPIVNLGRDAFDPVMKILRGFRYIDVSHVKRVPEKNNHCFLHYHDQSHKCEILKGGVPPLTYGRLTPALDSDLLLVNFISGSDIKLDALEKFRARFHGLIYLDIHSHTLGRRRVKGGYRRHLRRPPHWKRYAACSDILQMNGIEFELLSGKDLSRKNVIDFFAHEVNHLKCLAITLGDKGCLIVYRKNAIVLRRVSAVEVQRVHDTTGCGDIFGAGFAMEYLRSRDPLKAARNGVLLAGQRCRRRGGIF